MAGKTKIKKVVKAPKSRPVLKKAQAAKAKKPVKSTKKPVKSTKKAKKLDWKDWRTTDYNPYDPPGPLFRDVDSAIKKLKDKIADKTTKEMVNPDKKTTKEMVNHPSHYGGAGNVYETIKVIEAWNLEDFCLGNTIKYISRAGKKHATKEGVIEDLKKAQFYLNRKISNLEKELGEYEKLEKLEAFLKKKKEEDVKRIYPRLLVGCSPSKNISKK